MTTTWTLTVDAASPTAQAAFWAAALGYAAAPPPTGHATWQDWLRTHGVPEDEWDDGAFLTDPTGQGPSLSFLRVPEPKAAKNRLHLDLKVGGGRHVPWEQRWPRVLAEVERLCALGASVLFEVPGADGRPDHLVLADPEGNEFCVV